MSAETLLEDRIEEDARRLGTGRGDTASAQKARVLVVDDDPGLLRLMELRLDAAGYRVTAVDSGERALAPRGNLCCLLASAHNKARPQCLPNTYCPTPW